MHTSWKDDGNKTVFKKRVAGLPKEDDEEGNSLLTLHVLTSHVEFIDFGNGYKIPKSIYDQLFDHQKTGVHWLWELHTQEAGGIVAGTEFVVRHIWVVLVEMSRCVWCCW